LLLRLLQLRLQLLYSGFETCGIQVPQRLALRDMLAFVDVQFGDAILDHERELHLPHVHIAIERQCAEVFIALTPVAVSGCRGGANHDENHQNPQHAFFISSHKLLPLHEVLDSLAEFQQVCLSLAGQLPVEWLLATAILRTIRIIQGLG